MGSFQEDIDCPVCNSPDCFRDCKWRTGEEYISCSKCGYKYVFKWKRDENGDLVLKDIKKGITAENLISEIMEVKNPYGSFLITNSRGSVSGSLKDIEEYNKFQKHIEKVLLESDISEVFLRRYVEGRFIILKLKQGLSEESECLWEQIEECNIPYSTSCIYCENKSREWDEWYDNICPECFEKSSDQSELECIEAEIEYQLIMNQIHKNKQTKND